jgi:hypothetical protein
MSKSSLLLSFKKEDSFSSWFAADAGTKESLTTTARRHEGFHEDDAFSE